MAAEGTVGERVRRYRRVRGLTQEALAAAAGVDRSYLGKIEVGDVLEPGADTVKRLAIALDVQLRALAEPLGWYGDEQDTPRAVVIAGRNFKGLTEQDIRVLEQMAELLETKQPDEKS